MVEHLPVVTVRELNRNPAAVLERVRRGERLIVVRHGRPVATLQPLDGEVIDPSTGWRTDVFGGPLGDISAEADGLSRIQKRLLVEGINSLGRMIPGHIDDEPSSEVRREFERLALRGLIRKTERGFVLTGRGMMLREQLLAHMGAREETMWRMRRKAHPKGKAR